MIFSNNFAGCVYHFFLMLDFLNLDSIMLYLSIFLLTYIIFCALLMIFRET